MSLSKKLDLWAQQFQQEGREEGRQEGLKTGEALALQKLLAKRFGTLPTDLVSLIGSASTEQLERWLDRVLDADSLDEVFR